MLASPQEHYPPRKACCALSGGSPHRCRPVGLDVRIALGLVLAASGVGSILGGRSVTCPAWCLRHGE